MQTAQRRISRPEDPPGWRLAHEVWDAVRHDSWHPVLKLAFLVVVVVAVITAGLVTLAAFLGPWSVAMSVGGAGGVSVARLIRNKLT